MVHPDFKEHSEDTLGFAIDLMFSYSSGGPFNRFLDCDMRTGMKAMLLRPWFIGTLVLAFAHQIFQKILKVRIPVVDSYLDPLLFLPILLQLILLERRHVFNKGPYYVLPWSQIGAVTLWVSVVCEVLFPRWNPAFTADYVDVICYFIGGVTFGAFLNAPDMGGAFIIKETKTKSLPS